MSWDESNSETNSKVEFCANVGSSIEVRASGQRKLHDFESVLSELHYLGEAVAAGILYVRLRSGDGEWVGLLVWGAAAYNLKDCERWMAGACRSDSDGSSLWAKPPVSNFELKRCRT
jgi:hypothetical protein